MRDASVVGLDPSQRHPYVAAHLMALAQYVQHMAPTPFRMEQDGFQGRADTYSPMPLSRRTLRSDPVGLVVANAAATRAQATADSKRRDVARFTTSCVSLSEMTAFSRTALRGIGSAELVLRLRMGFSGIRREPGLFGNCGLPDVSRVVTAIHLPRLAGLPPQRAAPKSQSESGRRPFHW